MREIQANTLNFSEAESGSETLTALTCMTSCMFAAIARKTSRKSSVERDFARQIEEQLDSLVLRW
jgi:hypothetical protein